MVLPLGIAREHLNDEIVEAVVELFLKRPGNCPFSILRGRSKKT